MTMALQFILEIQGVGNPAIYMNRSSGVAGTPGKKLYCARAGAVYDADAAGAGTSASQQRHLKY